MLQIFFRISKLGMRDRTSLQHYPELPLFANGSVFQFFGLLLFLPSLSFARVIYTVFCLSIVKSFRMGQFLCSRCVQRGWERVSFMLGSRLVCLLYVKNWIIMRIVNMKRRRVYGSHQWWLEDVRTMRKFLFLTLIINRSYGFFGWVWIISKYDHPHVTLETIINGPKKVTSHNFLFRPDTTTKISVFVCRQMQKSASTTGQDFKSDNGCQLRMIFSILLMDNWNDFFWEFLQSGHEKKGMEMNSHSSCGFLENLWLSEMVQWFHRKAKIISRS